MIILLTGLVVALGFGSRLEEVPSRDVGIYHAEDNQEGEEEEEDGWPWRHPLE